MSQQNKQSRSQMKKNSYQIWDDESKMCVCFSRSLFWPPRRVLSLTSRKVGSSARFHTFVSGPSTLYLLLLLLLLLVSGNQKPLKGSKQFHRHLLSLCSWSMEAATLVVSLLPLHLQQEEQEVVCIIQQQLANHWQWPAASNHLFVLYLISQKLPPQFSSYTKNFSRIWFSVTKLARMLHFK